MKNRCLIVILLLFLFIALTGNAQATSTTASEPQSLTVVQIGSSDDLNRFASTRLPMYAMLEDALLTGADQAGQQTLKQLGLRFEVLDSNPGLGTYYLVETRSSRKAPDFDLYGQVLLKTSQGVLLRMDPSRLDALTQAGAEISLITLTPKPLPETREGAAFPQVVDPDPLIQQMVDQVQLNQVSYYDRQLAGELPVWVDGGWYTITTRNTYSGTPIQKTTHFVGQHMANDLGLNVEYHNWNSTTNPNVIGEIPGMVNPEDIFIIGAHIDDVNGTPGADDNASGSVATLLAADILSQYDWGCTLRFAFWTGEEQGLLGSAAYAQRASQRDENILGYLNLDMIAWNTIGSPPVINLFYTNSLPPTHELAQLFADVVDAYNLNLLPVLGTGVTGSDHYSFWQQGFTSILAIEDDLGGDFNPYYHGSGDTPAHTDLAYFTNFVKASIGTYAHMSGCLIPSGVGALDGHVTAAEGGAPLEAATVTADDGLGHSYTTTTDASGYYTRTLMSGIYTVTASAYSYLPSSVSGVEIVTDTLTTLDLALTLAPTYTVSGTVTEAGTGNPLAATISFIGSPVVVTSDPLTGFFQATLPEDSYTMQVRADLHSPQERAIVLDHNQTQNFALQPLPCILLVDDDQNNPNVRSYYTQALDSNGYDYSIWDVSTQGNPAEADLAGYRNIMWFNGYPYSGSFTQENETAVAAYLNDGGNFFLSSQEYLYERNLTPFGQSYLHIASYTSDVYQISVTGQNVFTGLGPYSLTYPFTNYSDRVSPDTSGRVAFLGNQGNAAISYDGPNFNTAFFGYPFEALPVAGRTVVMERLVDGFFGGCVLPPAVSIEPPSQAGTGEPGTQVNYEYTVTNTGGSAQNVHMSVAAEWPTLVFPEFTGTLVPGASTSVTVTVNIPTQLSVISDTFTLTAQGLVGGVDTATGTTSADVSPGVAVLAPANGQGEPLENVSYEFTVTNTGDYTDSFTLEASGLWQATLPGGNSTGPLAAGVSLPVTVLVQVPEDIADGEADVTTLVASSNLDPHVSASGNVTTTAIVYNVDITPLAQGKSGKPGSQVSYDFTVTNLAGAPQEVLLSVTGNSWPVEAPASTGLLAGRASITIPVTVTIPTLLEGKSDSFTLTAQGVEGGVASATGLTTANVNPGVDVVAPANGDGQPLQVVSYEFTLTNTGDYTDSFSLEVGGLWNAALPGGNHTGSLAPGESLAVIVEVTIPEAASDGDMDTTTLTATSVLDENISASAGVTTTAVIFDVSITPPTQEKSGLPGMQVSYVYTVTNLASAPQDVLLSVAGNDWPTEAPASTGELAAHASTAVTVNVTIPNLPESVIVQDSFTLTAEGAMGGTATATGTTLANVHPGVVVNAPPDGFGQPLELVSYTFTVTNSGDYTDSFSLDVDGLWSASLPGGNNTGRLAAKASTAVMVQVMVPGDAAGGDTDATTLIAISNLDANISASATVTTTAVVYHITVGPSAQDKSGEPGTQVSYAYTVTNASSLPQDIQLTTASAWPAVVFPASTGVLDPGVSTIVTVTVTIPAQLTKLSDTFTLTAEGYLGGVAGATGTTTADVTLGVSVTTDGSGYVRPGEVIGIAFEVTNTGDYTDTFTLQVSGLWPSTIEGGNVVGPLPPGGSGVKLVLVEVPANITGGVTDITTLTATSTLDPAVFAKASTTLISWYVNYLLLISR